MPENKRLIWCARHCTCRPGKFWNNFFQSPSPWSYFIILIMFLNIFYWCYYSAIANNTGTLSSLKYSGYIVTSISSLCLFVFGLFAIHALNVLWPSLFKIVFIQIGLGTALLLSIGAIVCYVHTPSTKDMQRHIHQYYAVYHFNPGFMRAIELERKCCGIVSFKDYIGLNNMVNNHDAASPTSIPSSCCKNQTGLNDGTSDGGHCIEDVRVPLKDVSKYYHTTGCIPSGQSYWDLSTLAPKSFAHLRTYFLCTLAQLVCCLLCFFIFNYYIFYKFPKRKLRCRNINQTITRIYRERDEAIAEATSELEVAEYMMEGPAILEWYNVHYLPKHGNARRAFVEEYTLPKKYEFPLFPFEEYKKHPETFIPGSNLDIHESDSVYVSPNQSEHDTDTDEQEQ